MNDNRKYVLQFTRREPLSAGGACYSFGWPIPDPRKDAETTAKIARIAIKVSDHITWLDLDEAVDGAIDGGYVINRTGKRFSRDVEEHATAFKFFDDALREEWPEFYKDAKPFDLKDWL